jgi:hypothetical protein
MPDILQVTENGRLKLKEDHPYYYQVKNKTFRAVKWMKNHYQV